MKVYRNTDVELLRRMAVVLKEDGFSVSDIIIPENQWVDGAAYFFPCLSG